MKKLLFLGGLLYFGQLQAQQVPTVSSPPNAGQTSTDYWSRAGNNSNGNNIFGTKVNSPIYTVTGSGFTTGLTYRTKLNGNFTSPFDQYSINTYGWLQGVNTTGYMLLGYNNKSITDNSSIYSVKGAFSLLHLNGQTASDQYQEYGYRPWMKTGITFTGNRDLSYIGMRQLGTGEDITETAIVWSDNTAGSGSGQDEVAFRYTSGGGLTTYDPDFANATDMDGLHVSRYTALGLMGMGNTFGVNAGTPATVVYNTPRSLMHLSYQYRANSGPQPQLNEEYGFMQITYRRPVGATTNIIGQGELATDGLRLGIDNQLFQPVLTATSTRHLNGYLRWQEASSFIIQTEDDTTTHNIEQNERIRVTSIGALKRNYGSQYLGLPLNENVTRISISESGDVPLTKPMSLLHLGYNYGEFPNTATSQQYAGYRKWMDLGMLASTRRDHVWVGIKPRDSLNVNIGSTNDKMDAVIGWGTDFKDSTNQGADNMRFIFTSDPLVASTPENPVAKTYDGLEMMRLYPSQVYNHPIYNTSGAVVSTVPSYGRVGIGDFTAQGVNEPPSHKLDVVGNGRFRYLPDSTYIADSLVNKIVMVDSNGVLRWKSFVPSEFGTYCADTVNGKLLDDKKVVLNNHNLYFTNHPDSLNLLENRMGLGYICGTNLPGKLSVWQKHDQTVNQSTIAGHFMDSDTTNNPMIVSNFYGVYGEANGLQHNNFKTTNNGGYFFARSAQVNFGVRGRAEQGGLGDPNFIGVQNIGGQFEGAFGSQTATGVVGAGSQATLRNYGVSGFASSPTTPSQIENVGGQFSGAFSTNDNMGVKAVGFSGNHAYGIYATASGGAINHAGFFAGAVEATSYITTPSDQQFKTNVTPLNGSLKMITTGLKPVSFYMDSTNFEQFNFDSKQQFGFIAQQVETTFPNLIHQSEFPAQYDSLGNVIVEAVQYKSVNYNGFIALNTQAIIELNQKVDKATLSDQSIKTNVQDLTGSLDKVLDMRGVSYDWNHSVHPELNLDSVNHIGFIAQEIQQIDSRLTFEGNDSLLHVSYDKVVPVLAEAIQELNDEVEDRDSIIDAQQNTIEDLNARLTNLENCLSALLPTLCSMNQSLIQNNSSEQQALVRKNLAVTLSDRTAIILDQNVPNPFAEQTVINFSIPATVQKAQIHFYDGNGKIIQSVDVVERGLGSLTVFGADLSSGTYTYTLVADGQIVATKKMVKQ